LVLVLDHQSFGRSYGVMMVCTALLGGVAAPLIIARPLVSLLAKKPVFKAKMLY
jgi:hypothetical protein